MRDCSCLGTEFSAPDTSPDYSECLCGTNKFLPPSDESVGPCDDTLAYDVSEMFETEACDNNVEYTIVSYTGFKNVQISGSNLTAVTDGVGGEINHSITIAANCNDVNLSVFATLQVYFKDVCKDLNCSETQTCDPCTETCVDDEVDIEIS